MRVIINFQVKQGEEIDSHYRTFQDAAGLLLPSVGESVFTPLGESLVEKREFEYDDDEIEITLHLSDPDAA